MKTLIISATGRKNGNIARACKKFAAEYPNSTYINLFDYSIKPCTGCLKCTQTKNCIIDDDFDIIYNQMIDAEHIVIGTPVYCHSIPGILKTFMDRCCSKVVPYIDVENDEPMLQKLKKVKLYQLQFSKNAPFEGKTFTTITSCSTPGRNNKDMKSINLLLKQFIQEEMKGKIVKDIRYTDTLFNFKKKL